jgi:WD40 repeat protein
MEIWLIAVHIFKDIKSGKEMYSGYRLAAINNNDDVTEIQDLTSEQLINQLANGIISPVNVELENDSIKSTRGSLDRYTKIYDSMPYGPCSLVVIKEYPDRTYAVINHLGIIERMTMSSLIAYPGGLANATVVNNEYIRSIGGEFEKDRSFHDFENGDRARAKLKISGMTDLTLDENKYLSGKTVKVDRVTAPVGCLGIAANGFKKNTNIKHVELSKTCLTLGSSSFEGCTSLETIIIPEGVAVIPINCFHGCTSLKKVYLPNSLRVINRDAFKGCRSLRELSIGPVRIQLAPGAVPSTTKMTIRR